MNTEFENSRDERRSLRKQYRMNRRNNESGRVLTGFFLLIAGAALFLRNMNTGIPDWVFSWPMLFIMLGIYFGVKHNFHGPLWLVLLLIGIFSLQDDIFPFINFRPFMWPAILMLVGIFFILRPRRDHRWETNATRQPGPGETLSGTYDPGDVLDVTSVFGSVKKVIVSKNFKGGEVVSFLGGCDINLSQADIQGTVRLDLTSVMGGTKLVVPANWNVQSEMVALFGGIEDKRDVRVIADPNKVLILDGTCLFGGVDIKSY